MTAIREVLVVGAGAMGCYFGARLAEGGARVRLVDVDAERMAMIDRQGVELEDDLGRRVVRLAAGVAAALPPGPADLVLVMTKAMHGRAALASVACAIGARTVILSLQNGLGIEGELAAVAPVAPLVLGVTDVPADFRPPRGVASHGAGRVWVGAAAQANQDAARRVFDLLVGCGCEAVLAPDIRVLVWEKAIFNAAFNAACALLEVPVAGLDRPEGLALIAVIVGEAFAVARLCGVLVDRQAVEAKIAHALAHQGGHQPSMLQDRRAGRPTEIDYINGAIAAAARAHGGAAPLNGALTDLVRLATTPPAHDR